MIRSYYRLVKPGIIYGNVFTTIAGFLFASHFAVAPAVFVATVIGIALVMAGGCVLNNIIDRNIDAKMERTKNRELVTGVIGVRPAFVYGSVLGAAGFTLLFVHVNMLTGYVALFGSFVYLILYTVVKRTSRFSTHVGSLAGAVPMLVGYTAFTGRIDAAGELLFIAMAIWQLPHFYSIALYRADEYRAAGIPILTVTNGPRIAKLHMIAYIVLFITTQALLFVLGYAGYAYLAAVLLAGLVWLSRALQGFAAFDEHAWAKSTFRVSLIVLMVFCVAVAFGPVLP